MNRSDDYGRRRRPDQRYGGFEEGYGRRAPGGNTVYYPGRSVQEERLDESSPHSQGYVSAYSNGYEDGYQAGLRAAQEGTSAADQGWRGNGGRFGSQGGGEYLRSDPRGARSGTGYEDYGVEAGRNFRQRPHVHEKDSPARGAYGYARPTGPKNYQRSDARLQEEVCERLAHAPAIDVSEVTVSVSGSVVTLTGSVDNRRTKYAVEDIADDTYGVTDVINQIQVRPYGVLASE
ncbi:BON domain-containing protein [Cupriavidus agavae]|uniref:BON domain-containing protein n=1 Tax=Cupriavidus agavae TaxID=1001822 RepID=A0A4Q7S279_9BURK|nr:BON domain-containing protein [Cupriavidus agavae]RZT39072.1 BON domain-containing protein [Cupriavidus agavae]